MNKTYKSFSTVFLSSNVLSSLKRGNLLGHTLYAYTPHKQFDGVKNLYLIIFLHRIES